MNPDDMLAHLDGALGDENLQAVIEACSELDDWLHYGGEEPVWGDYETAATFYQSEWPGVKDNMIQGIE